MDWVKEKTKLQLDQIREKGAVTARGNSRSHAPETVTTRLSRFLTLTHELYWLVGGMALGSMIVLMVWKSELVDVRDNARASSFSVDVSKQQHNLVEPPSQFSATDTEGLRNDIILLTEEVEMLTTTVSGLKIKLQSIQAATNTFTVPGNDLASDASLQQDALSGIVTRIETLPFPAASASNGSASDGKDADKLGDAASSLLVATEIQTQETNTNIGPWAINLASLRHKADAERFMENAESRGIKAGVYQATVRGRDYWRVHVPGFTTAVEARTKASLLKEKLGLKDVWVAKR